MSAVFFLSGERRREQTKNNNYHLISAKMNGYQPTFGSPQRLGSNTTTALDSNPFAHPRLSAPPQRLHSPYQLSLLAADSTSRTIVPSTQAAFTAAERQNRSDEMLESLLGSGSDRDLNRLSIAGNHHTNHGMNHGTGGAFLSSPKSVQPAFHSSSNTTSPARMNTSNLDEQYYNLLKSAREGDIQIVKTLLSTYQLDVNFTDRDGDTALHRACAGGHLKMVHLLVLDYHADVDRTNHLGDTPLLVQAKSTSLQPALLKFLIQCGSDIYHQNSAGVNTIQLCAALATTTASSTSPPTYRSVSGFSGFSPSSTSPLPSDLQQSLIEAHNSPVRQFVLLQQQQFQRQRDQLTAAAQQEQAFRQLQTHSTNQDHQIRAYQTAMNNGLSKLRDLDGELERTYRTQYEQQQQLQQQELQQRQQQHMDGSDGHSTSPSLILPPQPQVFIHEVRQALQSVRTSFVSQ